MASVFVKVRNSGLQTYNIREKRGSFANVFLNFSEILECPFLSKHVIKNICGRDFRALLSCRLVVQFYEKEILIYTLFWRF